MVGFFVGAVFGAICVGLVAPVLSGPVARDAAPGAMPAAYGPVRVVRISDGDTLVIEWVPPAVTVRDRVRLPDVDCPERGRPGAAEAAGALRDFIAQASGSVYLSFPGDAPARDSLGRIIADISTPSAGGVSRQLLDSGLCPLYDPHARERNTAR